MHFIHQNFVQIQYYAALKRSAKIIAVINFLGFYLHSKRIINTTQVTVNLNLFMLGISLIIKQYTPASSI